MSKDNSSQMHNSRPKAQTAAQTEAQTATRTDADGNTGAGPRGWDPTTPFRLGFTMWTRLAADQLDRVQSFYDEVADIENQNYERARRTGHEFATMVEQGMTFMTKMSAEWQALTLESMRRSREYLTSK